MQSIRFLIFFLSCMLVLSILLIFRPAASLQTQDLQRGQGVRTYFNWRTPSSLFPPSAIISLTDDNSTFFLARPAAFGSDLPSRSLSGQLWIGSGFGADHAGQDGPGGGMEGELGCSDVPGWSETNSYRSGARVEKEAERTAVNENDSIDDASKQDQDQSNSQPKWSLKLHKADVDGTDDHLKPLSKRKARRQDERTAGSKAAKTAAHADIQSLQESAEIAGKVALLSRGGCGFLDKVEWAQRRGAVAVIIGDDVRGGPLVTMYARGDTSNVSIPALFTSHTTAHLLSSLMPTGGRQRFFSPKTGSQAERAKNVLNKRAAAAASSTVRSSQESHDGQETHPVQSQQNRLGKEEGSGWFWSLFGTDGVHGKPALGKRPADGASEAWILQTDFEDDQPAEVPAQAGKKGIKPANNKPTDGFVIGVQDWRDPDLVGKGRTGRSKKSSKKAVAEASPSKRDVEKDDQSSNAASTPNSGEYSKPAVKASKAAEDRANAQKTAKSADKEKGKGWLKGLVSSQSDSTHATTDTRNDPHIIDSDQPVSNPAHLHDIHIPGAVLDEITDHEGLWVTLTATSVSNSPFLDTLLVLVVSPLVTLTVVYALLLLRSRIRRRRWRAPKSVVERLPVRTYQTMSSTSVSSVSSSVSPPASLHTPLLSSAARPIVHRPRSRTELNLPSSSLSASQSLEHVEEKREAALAEWRRKYGGKQKECVVCLEEYVDGVSRVMSLPCGHEFHEGCITPWLTTRRRTCPICKGDVVRSLARSAGSASSPLAGHDFRDEDENDVQEQAALLTNNDPNSLRPISRQSDELDDLEQGFTDTPDRSR